MAVLRLNTSCRTTCLHQSLCNDDARSQCPPTPQGNMAALKLITSGLKFRPQNPLSQNCARPMPAEASHVWGLTLRNLQHEAQARSVRP
eukprot:9217693-Karenia_brevis.AAC.1